MLIWKSDSTSSRNASNSSSARSTSSISSTARSPARTASSSGRSSRNFGPNSLSTASSSVELALGQRPDLQHLPGVVPLVQRLVGVDALVALQPDQPAAEHRAPAPWRPRSCRRRPRPRAGRAAAGTARRTAPWPARGRRGSRRRAATRSARPTLSGRSMPARLRLSRLARLARGPGRGCCRPRCSACPRGRSRSRQAARRSLPGSAKPSKLTSFMFLQDFSGRRPRRGPQLLWPCRGPHRRAAPRSRHRAAGSCPRPLGRLARCASPPLYVACRSPGERRISDSLRRETGYSTVSGAGSLTSAKAPADPSGAALNGSCP